MASKLGDVPLGWVGCAARSLWRVTPFYLLTRCLLGAYLLTYLLATQDPYTSQRGGPPPERSADNLKPLEIETGPDPDPDRQLENARVNQMIESFKGERPPPARLRLDTLDSSLHGSNFSGLAPHTGDYMLSSVEADLDPTSGQPSLDFNGCVLLTMTVLTMASHSRFQAVT